VLASPKGGNVTGNPGPPRSGQEFLARFGDAIDDRVAEILDESLDQLLRERNVMRRPRWVPPVLRWTAVVLALAALVTLALGLVWA